MTINPGIDEKLFIRFETVKIWKKDSTFFVDLYHPIRKGWYSGSGSSINEALLHALEIWHKE